MSTERRLHFYKHKQHIDRRNGLCRGTVYDTWWVWRDYFNRSIPGGYAIWNVELISSYIFITCAVPFEARKYIPQLGVGLGGKVVGVRNGKEIEEGYHDVTILVKVGRTFDRIVEKQRRIEEKMWAD